jgi:ABC-type sugar transport system substrate-binding protein
MGAQIRVAIVPKLLGLPVFEANVAGARQVARSLDIDLTYTATSTASAPGQALILQSLIKQKYNVIALSADDPTIPDSVLEQAMKAGIKVISFGCGSSGGTCPATAGRSTNILQMSGFPARSCSSNQSREAHTSGHSGPPRPSTGGHGTIGC